MGSIGKTEGIDHHRRRLLAAGSMGIAAAGAASLLPSHLAAAPADDAIRLFRIDVPEERLADAGRAL